MTIVAAHNDRKTDYFVMNHSSLIRLAVTLCSFVPAVNTMGRQPYTLQVIMGPPPCWSSTGRPVLSSFDTRRNTLWSVTTVFPDTRFLVEDLWS